MKVVHNNLPPMGRHKGLLTTFPTSTNTNKERSSSALQVLRMTTVDALCLDLVPRLENFIFTCRENDVICMKWINFPPIHAACL